MNRLTNMYGGQVTEAMNELQLALENAQKNGLGTCEKGETAEIGLEVKLRHRMERLTEALAEYSVLRCHCL